MKRLPSLTPSQRRALLIIEWVLLLGIIGYALWKSEKSSNAVLQVVERRDWYSAAVKPFTYAEQERRVESFPFDPNTADSTTLLRLGLSPWQVRSIYRYRAKLGRYHTPEDFMRVPNLTVEQWDRLKDYVRIAPQFRYVEPPAHRYVAPSSRPQAATYAAEPTDTAVRSLPTATPEEPMLPRQDKLKPGQTVDIATADTTLLKQIPGIASRRAASIVRYRELLGGFVSPEQAMEASEMPDSVLSYMTVSSTSIRKLNINKLSVQQLMKHPYINFYQAKAIVERRRNEGSIRSLDDLSRLQPFRPTDIERLRPYLSFE